MGGGAAREMRSRPIAAAENVPGVPVQFKPRAGSRVVQGVVDGQVSVDRQFLLRVKKRHIGKARVGDTLIIGMHEIGVYPDNFSFAEREALISGDVDILSGATVHTMRGRQQGARPNSGGRATCGACAAETHAIGITLVRICVTTADESGFYRDAGVCAVTEAGGDATIRGCWVRPTSNVGPMCRVEIGAFGRTPAERVVTIRIAIAIVV